MKAAIFSLCALTQTNQTGDIVGKITDPTGAAVVGAKVTLTSLAQGSHSTLTTDKTGASGFRCSSRAATR